MDRNWLPAVSGRMILDEALALLEEVPLCDHCLADNSLCLDMA